MAPKKSVGHAYNIDFLNVVFAVSSILLFISVIWMVWDDFDREWKNTQRRFTQLEMEVTRQEISQAAREIDTVELQRLEEQRALAQVAVQSNQEILDELFGQVDELDGRLYRETQDYQFSKATYDVDRYEFEVERKSRGEVAVEEWQVEIQEQAREVEALDLIVEETTAERVLLQGEINDYTADLSEVQTQIDEMLGEQRRLQDRLKNIAPSLGKTLLLNAPMTDFLAPTIKVKQIVLPNIHDDVNFMRVPKMDRCTTCHLSIDRQGYEEYPQPFRTHSNLDAYLGSNSPHPIEAIGCTVCHEGMGQSVSFRDAVHTPSNDEQAHEWEEQHHWEPSHYWDYPMLPIKMTEASCAKCHREEVFIPRAPELTLAYATYERAGCYACHKTKGFEDLRKPGPNLTKIKSKLTPEWVENWIREPRAVKPATWMPQVWYNSNSSSPEDAIRNEAEITAVVEYLFDQSEEYVPAVSSPPRGDTERGKAVVEKVGCLGCHVTEGTDRSTAGPRRTFGQPLQGVGSKTTYTWLYNWVRDPKHYSPETFMPNLRLTDREVADVAAYLASLTGESGTTAFVTVEQQVVDDVLLDYLKSVMPSRDAEAKLSSMDSHAKQLELGEQAILRYGCFSCHEIKGFEGAQPIGVELTEEASKLVTRLDFAFVDIPHTKLAWFTQKLHDPRSFDQDRVLKSEERLRMPNSHLSEQETQRLVTAIMSFQRNIQPRAALPPQTARNEFLSVGRNFTQRRNCVGCHSIEGNGGDYVNLVEEASLAPPPLTPEGSKVRADWLYAFLKGPISIRPWLEVRMPTFGLEDDHLNAVIHYFQAIPDQVQPFRTIESVKASKETAIGKELFELLRCQQCHVLGEIPADQPTANLAPDLRMSPERLNPEWIDDWMIAPLRIQPGTRMPQFWPNHPKSDFPQFDGDGDRQIRAIRNYLLTLQGGPSPN